MKDYYTPLDPGVGEVTVEMRGMVRTIRRHLLLDQINIAQRIADEIERQTSEVNLDATIAQMVTEELARVRRDLRQRIAKAIETEVDSEVRFRVGTFAQDVAAKIATNLIKQYSDVK